MRMATGQKRGVEIVLPERLRADDGFLAELAALNREARIERNEHGELVVMSPTHRRTGRRNATITGQLYNYWISRGDTSEIYDSSTGFRLPNGAVLSPDAAWVSGEHLAQLKGEEFEDAFLPLTPDFVIELRSSSDRLADLVAKMEAYLGHGTRLGWLIDPVEKNVLVFRPGQPTETVFSPSEISAHPELPGFILDLRRIF
jgi:Uma2 family endonuclease